MKLKFLPTLAAIFAFAALALSQTITITPKKTVYTRKGKVSFKEKRTFTVTYPLFNGTMSPAAKKKLEKTISYWNVFGSTLVENMQNDWLDEASYQVNYNRDGFLDISLTQEGSAAYPDSQTINLVVDLKTGEHINLANVLKPASRAKLAEMVNQKLQAETSEIAQRIDKGEFGENDKESDDSLKEQLKALEFTVDNFNEFKVNDKGMTILFDASFPHVIQAAQPDGQYFFTWAELKPFVRPDGLLGKFVK